MLVLRYFHTFFCTRVYGNELTYYKLCTNIPTIPTFAYAHLSFKEGSPGKCSMLLNRKTSRLFFIIFVRCTVLICKYLYVDICTKI